MNAVTSLFDSYGRKARLYPALLVLLPVVISYYLWFPEQLKHGKIIWGLAISFGGLVLLGQMARECGKRSEEKLITQWGGLPTTLMLREDDNTIDPVTKGRYFEYFTTKIKGFRVSESKPEGELYINSAIRWLREQTRDKKKYPLVFIDNINYGFARNTFGLKPIGIIVSGITFLANIIGLYLCYGLNIYQIPFELLGTTTLSLLFILMWILFVNEKWVRSTGDAYARTLLATCDVG